MHTRGYHARGCDTNWCGAPSKNKLKPWLKEQRCIPPRQNAEFVYHMEDVLGHTNVLMIRFDRRCAWTR